MVDSQIKEYVEQQILPRYALFDAAHNIDHATTVIEQSAKLASHYPELDATMVYIIAAYHDTGLCDSRERHHIVSGQILRSDKFITSRFSPHDIQTMAQAVEDHRASSKSEPRSLYGRIVAEADRLISTDTTLRRTVQYGLKLNPDATTEQHFERFNEHLQHKYATGGYIKLYIPESDNAQRLAQLRQTIENPTALRELFDKIFHEESLRAQP